MIEKPLSPDDPRVLEYVLQRIRTMSREEMLQRLRRQPDFDEAWVLPEAEVPAAEAPVVVDSGGARRPIVTRR
jgi:hypothetical protein